MKKLFEFLFQVQDTKADFVEDEELESENVLPTKENIKSSSMVYPMINNPLVCCGTKLVAPGVHNWKADQFIIIFSWESTTSVPSLIGSS